MSDPDPPPRAILVIGGYGGFGARLSRRLSERGHRIVIAGRSDVRARALAASLRGAASLALDVHADDLAERIAASGAFVVVDAAGPFQGQRPRVALAALSAGAHYCDLADARDFVCGFGALDAAARQAGLCMISGASSVPALSGAAVRNLAERMDRVASVDIAISASNRGGAGESVARAMLSYAGQTFAARLGGREVMIVGWRGLVRRTIAIAGGVSLGRRWFADADVPDLALLPGRLPGNPTVRFRAGTDRALQVFGLWFVAWLVRIHWIGSGLILARLLRPLQRLTGLGASAWSGMEVRVVGEQGARPVEREWTLLVGDGKGPEVPTLAAVVLVEQILAGRASPGAADAGQSLKLEDFDELFDGIGARRAVRERVLPPPLYRRVLGHEFDRLPPAVKAMHSIHGIGGAAGRGQVERGRNPLAKLVATIMRFPRAGEHVLHVLFDISEGSETWTRDFAGQRFRSRLSMAAGRLTEAFGPLRFHFDLPADESGLEMLLHSWTAFGVPMPMALAPRICAREWQEEHRFRFDVAIALPLVGPVIRYRGWLDRIA